MAEDKIFQSRGIRGAITVDSDTPESIEKAVIELYSQIVKLNNFSSENISHIIFTLTKDLKSAFPAKFLRQNFDVQYVPLMCFNELDIEPSLKMCLRMLVVINTQKSQQEIKHVYLKGAKVLRPDIK